MDGEAARRIMSNEYGNTGQIQAGSFAARGECFTLNSLLTNKHITAQSAAAKNMNAGVVPGWEASANSGQSKGTYMWIAQNSSHLHIVRT